jgi:PAS domain S-box-containing protein
MFPAWLEKHLARLRRDSRVIGLLGISIIVLIAALSLFLLQKSRDFARVSAEIHSQQLSKTVTHQMLTTINLIEHAMRFLNDSIRITGRPERLAELGASGQLPTDGISHFAFVAPDARVIYDSLNRDRQSVPLGPKERAFFDAALQPGDDIYITPPIPNSLSRDLFLPISRAVRDREGKLMGVLVAMIDVRSLDRIWSDLGLDSADSIELIDKDGKVWLRWPRAAAGETPPHASTDRPIAVQPLGDWHLSFAASIDMAAVERQLAPAQRAIVLAAVAASLLVAWFTWMLMRLTRQARNERDVATRLRAHLLTALDAVPVEFIEYDRDRRAVLVNAAARQSQAAPIDAGDSLEAILDARLASGARAGTEDEWTAWKQQAIADFEHGGIADLRRPDGQWQRAYTTELSDGGRIVVGVDITAIKRREELLAAEMERFGSVFQTTGAVILMLDRMGCVLLANQPALDIHGLSGAEIAGRPYEALKFAGLGAGTIEAWRRAEDGQRLEPAEFECSLAGANGERRIFRFTANPVEDDLGRLRYVVLIGVDDTERRAAEVRVFNISRLANLGEMASGVAHELNQPLAIMRLAADRLREEIAMPELQALPAGTAEFFDQKLARIVGQIERASAIIGDLRAVARKPNESLHPFDLAAATRVSSDLLGEQMRLMRIDYAVDLRQPGPMVMGEPSRIQQVLINLVLNARDALVERASGSGNDRGDGPIGRIGVHVGVETDRGSTRAVLTVEDDGPGIPDAVMLRLFEPFFTTKPLGKGTGLGLSISNQIVRGMGGELSAQNLGPGVRFRVVLPIAPTAEAAEPGPAAGHHHPIVTATP